ncbi:MULTISPECIES: hypothetical protein [Aliivibrio]|uniref:Uncharacterized protein n=1 Tax=Aliivibrio finisterrensis TaxID=511998 RepID=A0A4Q5L2H9_9GAMM|nr:MULTISPECIES: hypothetical protein [Aliivibrio]MDD9178314.1 hypothetical protein [Aliivibrio sp. A6]RYU54884.1 hypothetical protein ERW57_01170 [Aliivibrio finisterrensis]RYU56560.1 hypothetical protein ERW56_00850 [Aliivibrio finisterrensis]RYU61681.1 hypothetical protein ERW50_00850 [Aliivibrio finisterrensis]RYU66510.1 hypothetical protein ERW53_02285 [Aliivibrio finisterrensis]
MDKILFDSKKYQLTKSSFTYQGHKEKLENVLGLNIIQWQRKDRVKYGMGLGIFSVIMFYTIGWFLILPILDALSGDELSDYLVEAVTSVVFIFFSVLGYLSRKGYTLEIEKTNGNKGTIGKSTHRLDFDKLLTAFVRAKKLE